MKIKKKNPDGLDYFDIDHYRVIRKTRKRKSLPVEELNIPLLDYNLIGHRLKSKKNGKIYLVEKANKQWYAGFYIGILLNHNGSHKFVYCENINSIADTIMSSCNNFWNEYMLME